MTAPGAPHYLPLLKGRMGELRALRELGSDHADVITPLLEIPLKPVDVESDNEDAPTVTASPDEWAAVIAKNVAEGRRIIIDASLAPPEGDGDSASAVVLRNLLGEGYDVIPTVRPSDSIETLAQLRAALGEWQQSSVCVRVAGDDLDPADVTLAESIERVLDEVGGAAEDAHLLLDFGSVADEGTVGLASRIARLALSEVPVIEAWRTVTVASGAFPADLNGVPPEVLTEVPRHDAVMWRAVRARARGRVATFGDYGIAYPVTQIAAGGFAPAPQLRYTHDDSWLIYKGRKRDRRGSAQFYDICRRMVEAGVVNPDISWGDRYVFDAGTLAEESGRGPGNAMMWRAIGTSHHLGYVVSRLANQDAP